MVSGMELAAGAGIGKKIFGKSSTTIPLALAGASVVGGGLKAFANVPSGHMGVRTRFERAERKEGSRREGQIYGTVKPGFRWVVPYSDSITTISTQSRNHQLEPLLIEFKRGGQTKVESNIQWHVSEDGDNPYKALFEVKDEETLTRTVADVSLSGLHYVLGEMKHRKQINTYEVEGNLKEHVKDKLLEFGTELDTWRLGNDFVSDAQMEINAAKYNNTFVGLGMVAIDAIRGMRETDKNPLFISVPIQ